MRRACIVPGCRAITEGTRCPEHARQAERARKPRRSVAAQVRRELNAAGLGRCARCGYWFPASALEVDHRLALADGGRDVRENIQLLCREHHHEKTQAENRARRRASG